MTVDEAVLVGNLRGMTVGCFELIDAAAILSKEVCRLRVALENVEQERNDLAAEVNGMVMDAAGESL